MVKYISIALVMAGLSVLSASVQGEIQGDAKRGAQAAAVCIGCHQADGGGKHIEGGESWPRLAGLNATYIAKQLHDFKSGNRSNASMEPFASMLNEQQIADVAAYYSQLPPTPGQGGETVDEVLLQRGETIALHGDWSAYLVSCKSCHGPDNQGAGTVFPGIAGQHAGYIESQLQAWKGGTRNNDPQDLMGSVARRTSDEDVRAVAAWLANQPPAANQEELSQ